MRVTWPGIREKKKRNRSICDLQNSSCRCCYFLSSSRCRLSRLKKTGSNFTPAPNFFSFCSIMRGRSRKNKRPILIALYSYLLFKFFVLLWLPVCGNSTSGQKCVLLFWGGFRVPQHQNGFWSNYLCCSSCFFLCVSVVISPTGLSKRSSNSCTLTRSIAEPMKYTCG